MICIPRINLEKSCQWEPLKNQIPEASLHCVDSVAHLTREITLQLPCWTSLEGYSRQALSKGLGVIVTMNPSKLELKESVTILWWHESNISLQVSLSQWSQFLQEIMKFCLSKECKTLPWVATHCHWSLAPLTFETPPGFARLTLWD